VDPTRFADTTHGRVLKTPGPHGFYVYIPAALPESLNLSSETVLILSDADRALGRLAGAGRQLPNPHILMQPYIAREALASSRIEGTQASLSDVFDARARGLAEGDIREVTNYISALETGLARLPSLPLSLRLLSEVHEVLLTGVRGQERYPGRVRESPNWIGSPDNRPETAVFVPPPVQEMQKALSDWEKYVNSQTPIPPLVKCALLHYQFETIHPFLDGNGRLGRLLIVFYLIEQGLLPQPLLYLSSYFEKYRSDYYDRLQAVRERGQLEEWIQFFLTGVAVQASDSLQRAEQLSDLRESYRQLAIGTRSRLGDVVELLFENPVITAQYAATRLSLTVQGVKNLIERLEREGVLVQLSAGGGRRPARWVARDIFDVLDAA
jgi:Fic family protein